MNGRQLVWLDNAATTQKPHAVIDRLAYFYEHENSNIHRAAHTLAARATDAYEGAREKVRALPQRAVARARSSSCAARPRPSTWSPRAGARQNIGAGDEIVITQLEHHANIVPWQQLAAEKGAKLRVAPVDDDGQILPRRVRAAARTADQARRVHAGLERARHHHAGRSEMVEHGAPRTAPACWSTARRRSRTCRVDVQALDSDFYVFSGHKVFAPTGIGVALRQARGARGDAALAGRRQHDRRTSRSRRPSTRRRPAASRPAPATSPTRSASARRSTTSSGIGLENIARYEHELLVYATARAAAGAGPAPDRHRADKAGVLSFVLDGYRTEDVGAALDQEGIAVRAGHHCAQPILRRFGLEATVRPSLALYNTYDEIDPLVDVLHRLSAQRGRQTSR